MENLKIIIDIVTAVAILTAAVVASRSLKTWEHQLKGQSEYELSRRILVTLFKYRDAVNGVRDSAMWANEMPVPPPEKAETMSQEQMHWYRISEAYQVRWDKVQERRPELYSDLLEAEAIWGTKLKELFEPIFKLEHELFVRVRHDVELINPDVSKSKKEAIERIVLKNRDILYDDGEDGDSEGFKSDLLKAIEKVEEYLKPKLQRK